MLSWEGRGTRLPLGFAALRVEAHRLQCWATAHSSDAGFDCDARCLGNPVHVLCHALRMAPPCYRRFELATSHQPLHVSGGGIVLVGSTREFCRDTDVIFDSISSLAVAMQHFARVEKLSVCFLPDECSIVVHRVGGDRPADAAEVQ